eukprot:515373_1
MGFNIGWYFVTITITLCSCTCIVLTWIQINSFKWFFLWNNQNQIQFETYSHWTDRISLYSIFITGLLCSIQCLTLHLSDLLPTTYCIFGVSVCTVWHIAQKNSLYAFFVQRAKYVQPLINNPTLNMITKYVFPVAIVTYFLGFSLIVCITFRGKIDENSHYITACLYYKFLPSVFITGAIVDALTCSVLLFLFIYPVYNLVNNSGTNHSESINKMKINVICTVCCSVSTIITLLLMSSESQNTIEYVWLYANIDMTLNSLFIFFMVDSNIKYIKYLKQNHFCLGVIYVRYSNNNSNLVPSAATQELSVINEVEERTGLRLGESRNEYHNLVSISSTTAPTNLPQLNKKVSAFENSTSIAI